MLPSLAIRRSIFSPTLRRSLATASRTPLSSDAYTKPVNPNEPAISSTPQDVTPEQREALEAALRIDQAGEVAANYIYMGQMAILSRDRKTKELLQEMKDQEQKHLDVMNKLQAQHDVRPTVLWEVAKVAGFGLGAVTALMGREAAMACTEAVETVIGEHYDDQLKEMDQFSTSHPSIPLLKEVIKEFRDDELEHLDTAVQNYSQRAPAHALLSTVIGGGCKIAIELCRRF
ncbi:5-demethoxyubiquinone hydroxylase, mitochondrial [Abortiporus biennis]